MKWHHRRLPRDPQAACWTAEDKVFLYRIYCQPKLLILTCQLIWTGQIAHSIPVDCSERDMDKEAKRIMSDVDAFLMEQFL